MLYFWRKFWSSYGEEVVPPSVPIFSCPASVGKYSKSFTFLSCSSFQLPNPLSFKNFHLSVFATFAQPSPHPRLLSIDSLTLPKASIVTRRPKPPLCAPQLTTCLPSPWSALTRTPSSFPSISIFVPSHHYAFSVSI